MSNEYRPWPSKIGLIVLLFCITPTFDLMDAWTSSPADRWGWIALLIWISPLAMMRWIRGQHDLIGEENQLLYLAALLTTLAGQVGRVNAIEHFAVLLACGGLLKCSVRSLVWMCAGACWLPAFGWLVMTSAPNQVLTARVALAFVGAGFVLAPLAERDAISLFAVKRGIFASGIIAAILLGTLWRFVPLQGAEERLLRMPAKGPGVASWNVPLKPEERQLLGVGLAVRRLYQVDDQKLLVSVVDGTLNRHAVHDPVYCFLGAGYRVVDNQQVEIQGGSARVLNIERAGRRSKIVYWFSDGEQRYTSIMQYWLRSTLRRATFGAAGPEPVLVIVQFDGEAEAEKYVRQCAPLFSV